MMATGERELHADTVAPADMESPMLGVIVPAGLFVVLLLLGLSPLGRVLNYIFTPAVAAMGLALLYMRPVSYLALPCGSGC
nr:hypothetical protein [Sphingomonas melonis]